MPNWCLNSIYIEGPEKEIEKFEEYVSTNKSTFSLHKIIPMPDKEKKTGMSGVGKIGEQNGK